MSKHTPGPWTVEMPAEFEMDTRPAVLGGKNGSQPVCEILGPLSDEDGPHRGHYDLALIAAAPDLLKALKELLPYAERAVAAIDARSAGDLYPAIRAAMLDRARVAITKAQAT